MTELLADSLDAILAALADGDNDLADTLAAYTPEELAEALGERSESVGLVDKIVTVHRADGTTFQQHRKVSAGDDTAPASSPHADTVAELAREFPEHAADPTLWGKVKGMVKAAHDRVNQFVVDNAGKFARVSSILNAVLTTPDDVAKNPALAGKFGAHGDVSGDMASAASGVPGSLVAKLAATVVVKGWGLAKRALGISRSEAAETETAVEMLVGLFGAAGIELDADKVREMIAGLGIPQPAASESRQVFNVNVPAQPAPVVNVTVEGASGKRTTTTKTAKRMPDGTWVIEETITDTGSVPNG